MADCFESRVFMESKIKDICDLQFFILLSGKFILIRFLIPITKGESSTFKDNKASSYIYTEPRQQLHILSLKIFSSVFFLPHIFHNLLSLPALTAGIMPGIKHLTETFCCSLNGCDKWQIVTAGAVLSKINQECAKNSDSFCRIPVWDRHCLDWRKRQLINSSQIKILGRMRNTEMSSRSQQVRRQLCYFLFAFARKIPKRGSF